MTVFVCVPLGVDIKYLKVFRTLSEARFYKSNFKWNMIIVKRVIPAWS